MATKSDFSSAEWEVLRDAPHLVILAVTVAGASGFFGSIAEALAPSGIINEALQGSNPLLREVCGREEIKSSIESIKELARASGDFANIQAVLRQEAVDKSRTAIGILRKKGSPEDVSVYRDFLIHLGDKVANAAKEGGFLGFGGERVSEHERTLLAELAEAVGMLQA
ncbi:MULTISPECIES: hypothetical protein [Methylomicrobium]|uniref:Uncharacterized protein n=1 Tax=Methylomicrobium album BG8 TaxID=686340 RepID=H8GGZ4_METAL|nr:MULTISPECIES: hypothetical protein [Methylomicrobium]EIC31269.1 hypothetical protein Metal_3622 [Methylomicrobium album BG8]